MPVHTEQTPGFEATIPVSGVVGSGTPRFSTDRHESGPLDHFLVERKLGQGGMGAVYLARDLSLDRAVAIKILPDELAREEGAMERFIREAQAQARLNSPHVVQIYFIGRVPGAAEGERGSLYFAMERVDGESLEVLLGRGERVDPELARQLMIQVARGLRDANEAGIIHRDIKPGNLLLGKDRHLKIADFGLAKPREKNLSLTREGAVMGTPYYIAPEQALGEPLDLRADMYALGCTFYHLIAGAPPFDGPTSMAVIARHLKEKPRPLRELDPEVPGRLAAIVDRLMQKDRKDRYATYDELVAALEEAAPERVEYAGFWARGAALALDGVMLSGLIWLLGWPGLVIHLAGVAAGVGYLGQTPGKYLLRIQVQRLDGGRLGLALGLARAVATIWLPFLLGLYVLWYQGFAALTENINGLARPKGVQAEVLVIVSNSALALVYAAGLALAAVQRQKRAVHDFLVGSRVIYRLGTRGGPALSRRARGPAREPEKQP
jgi:uncharacterized RDD family membrane protein YckC